MPTFGAARTRTTITRYESRSLVQPPSQHTSQSSKREPIVTGVRRRRNLVSNWTLPVGVHTFIPLRVLTVKSLDGKEIAQGVPRVRIHAGPPETLTNLERKSWKVEFPGTQTFRFELSIPVIQRRVSRTSAA